MVEHIPWCGCQYQSGIEGQKLAVVGYSHYWNPASDHDLVTRECVEKLISGKWNGKERRFFSSVRNYFGFTEDSEFWPRVVFFNFLPNSVGDREAKFGGGTDEQVARGHDRFLSILAKEKPDKIFIFTQKGWDNCPPIEEKTPLALGSEFSRFSWGTYVVGGHFVKAFGLRHPQGADGELMRRTVRHILSIPSE